MHIIRTFTCKQAEAIFTFINVDKFSNGWPPLINLATIVDKTPTLEIPNSTYFLTPIFVSEYVFGGFS